MCPYVLLVMLKMKGNRFLHVTAFSKFGEVEVHRKFVKVHGNCSNSSYHKIWYHIYSCLSSMLIQCHPRYRRQRPMPGYAWMRYQPCKRPPRQKRQSIGEHWLWLRSCCFWGLKLLSFASCFSLVNRSQSTLRSCSHAVYYACSILCSQPGSVCSFRCGLVHVFMGYSSVFSSAHFQLRKECIFCSKDGGLDVFK